MIFYYTFLFLPCSWFRLLFFLLPNKTHILFWWSFPPPTFEITFTFNNLVGFNFHSLQFWINWACKILHAFSFLLPILIPLVTLVIIFFYASPLSHCCFYLNNDAANKQKQLDEEKSWEKEEAPCPAKESARGTKHTWAEKYSCCRCILNWLVRKRVYSHRLNCSPYQVGSFHFQSSGNPANVHQVSFYYCCCRSVSLTCSGEAIFTSVTQVGSCQAGGNPADVHQGYC